jgi:hypothetical protein
MRWERFIIIKTIILMKTAIFFSYISEMLGLTSVLSVFLVSSLGLPYLIWEGICSGNGKSCVCEQLLLH